MKKLIGVTTIYFTSADGVDAVQFDTQDAAELLELFHVFLVESKITLVSVDGIEYSHEEEI